MANELHSVIFDANGPQEPKYPSQLNFFPTDYSADTQQPQSGYSSASYTTKAYTSTSFEDEPPLLEGNCEISSMIGLILIALFIQSWG